MSDTLTRAILKTIHEEGFDDRYLMAEQISMLLAQGGQTWIWYCQKNSSANAEPAGETMCRSFENGVEDLHKKGTNGCGMHSLYPMNIDY